MIIYRLLDIDPNTFTFKGIKVIYGKPYHINFHIMNDVYLATPINRKAFPTERGDIINFIPHDI